jgi:predicted CXXCH cytochrome family protein
MKTMIYKGLLGATLAVVGLAASAGTIVGSKHDFTTAAGQVCVACHAPHNAAVLADAPLWNHQLNAAQTYTVYASATMNATVGQPGSTSKLCLSCHDGTLAVNNFGGVTTATNKLTGTTNLGTDLSNDHPIGITYDTALSTADGALKDPSTTTVTIGDAKTKTGLLSAVMLYANKLECASCHDVHNTFAVATTKMVKTSATTICTTCHVK